MEAIGTASVMSITDKIEQLEPTTNPMDNALCLILEISCLGNTRKVPSNAVQTPADRAFLHITKNLIAKSYMKDLTSLHGELRSYISRKCLPASSMFRRGTYLIPTVTVEEVYTKIEEFMTRQSDLVDKLVAVYEAAQEDAKQRLGPLYNPSDYPSKEDVKAAYSIKKKLVAFHTPTKLKEISEAVWNKEVVGFKEDIALATDEIKMVLRAGLSEVTNHLVDKLSPSPDGKKIFRNSLVENVKEFLEDFNSRNIVNDVELAALVEKAKACINGVDAKMLRDDVGTREKVKKDFTTIKDSLDKMMEPAPKRVFDFEDDGEKNENN